MTDEATVQQAVRLRAAYARMHLWRNNVGACEDKSGRVIRYGLGNDSAQLNRAIKSSDLIGMTPVVITPEMVGRTLAVFTAIECKRPGWKLTNADERGRAQKKFIDLVKDAGGFAGFATSADDVDSICAMGE